MQGCEQFGIGGGKSRKEISVGRGERFHRGAIAGSGHGQVGDGVNSVLLIGLIGGLGSCAGHGYERLAPFLMGGSEEGFKVRTGIEVRGLALPYFTVVDKQTCLKTSWKAMLTTCSEE